MWSVKKSKSLFPIKERIRGAAVWSVHIHCLVGSLGEITFCNYVPTVGTLHADMPFVKAHHSAFAPHIYRCYPVKFNVRTNGSCRTLKCPNFCYRDLFHWPFKEALKSVRYPYVNFGVPGQLFATKTIDGWLI